MATKEILSLENPVFSCYLFYVSLLTVKLILMSPFTGIQRMKKKVNRNKKKINKLTIIYYSIGCCNSRRYSFWSRSHNG